MGAIKVNNVSKRFGDVQALDNVSLTIESGAIYALLGPNGAGKTTLIKTMTTLLKPDQGSVEVGGYDVVTRPRRVREIMGLAGQFAAVDENLTGRENLEMVGRLYHLGRSESRRRAGEILERLELMDAADRRSKTYSGGMRRRLDLGASFITAPRVLFLDEPTSGLDPYARVELWQIIRELVREGTTLMLTTQNLEEAEELADRIAIIDEGRIIAEGTDAQLKDLVGGNVLEFRLRSEKDLQPAAALTADLFLEAPAAEPGILRVSGPVKESTGALIEAVRRLDREQMPIADIRLRRPSLNEVFLTLTHKPGRK
ncbi:MAG: ATP-binding cassette domain-containing protein [Thermoleophilia bacterium]